METVDRMSQRMLSALADAAEVLTHAQRQELAAEWKSHGKHDRRDKHGPALRKAERDVRQRPLHSSRRAPADGDSLRTLPA